MNASFSKAIKASADPQRARHYLHLFSETSAGGAVTKASAEQTRILAAVFSGSEALSNLLIAHPDWLKVLEPETLKFPRRKQGLAAEIGPDVGMFVHQKDYASVLKHVRELKQCELLRIGARDLSRVTNVQEITRELSDLADVCLQTVWQVCLQRLTDKHGMPFHQDVHGRWHPTTACLLGMGKLGGQELNYSSDVDVLFVYAEEGNVFLSLPDRKKAQRTGLSNNVFFCRLAEAFIAEVSAIAPEGMLYRIDLRLRPEGDAGPLARSVASYENYYAQWGQTWERMMLIKARDVAGDTALAAEFLEMIQPFRYPRSISSDVLREVAAMKDRIENEVLKQGELERNVKLGRGGIREIEFVAQSQQLLHAGKQPFLQGAQTIPTLEKLAQYELLQPQDRAALRDAYCFLRDVEHRLQMEGNLQTHSIPSDQKAEERLARLMGFSGLKKFETAHGQHRVNVRRIFDKILKGEGIESETPSSFPRTFEGTEEEWKELLNQHRFRDVEKAFRVLREFVEGPGYVHVSPRTRELAMRLLPRLFSKCSPEVQSPKSGVQGPGAKQRREKTGSVRQQPSSLSPLPSHLLSPRPSPLATLSDPDRVVTRLDSFIAAYGARGTLFELWNSNPAIFDLLVLLFDRSEFLAELAIRTPDLVDELVVSGRLRQRKTSAETLEDLRHGIDDSDQHAWIRKYHQAELMRIGLRDILGLADEDQYLTELSALADACLQYALEVVMKRHGLRQTGRRKGAKELNELNENALFAIIGLGKLGGAEIDYGSDLDILFVADGPDRSSRGNEAQISSSRRSRSQSLVTSAATDKMARMASEIMDLLSHRTEHGLVFHTDARLRPDGEKGLLVNTIQAYEEYYRGRAALWEIQSLTRTRAVAGNKQVGEEFQKLAARLANFRQPSLPLAAYTTDWKQKIHHMRMRIEKERTPAGKDDLAIKTGKGGLVDAEFVAQGLCLENGWREANTVRALERVQSPKSKVQSPTTGTQTGKDEDPPSSKALRRAGEWREMVQAYRRLRRVEGILRRWSYEGETVLPDDPAPYYRVAIRCGFPTAEAFRQAVANWKSQIRVGYLGVFGKGK